MPKTLPYAVTPGGLTPRDHDAILTLAARGWGSTRIGRKLGKHPSTINWFMHRQGLRTVRPVERADAYVRNGRLVRRFTRDEDVLMSALRVQGFGLSEIADVLTKRFGHPRNAHAVHNRLTMLAAQDAPA